MKRKIYVASSSIDGNGVFALVDIKEGELIGVISGFIPDEVDPNCYHTIYFYAGSVTSEEVWIPLEPRYPFRYLNHSRDPNARCPSPALVAIKDIKANEEITIDYGSDWDVEESDEEE